MKSTTQKSYLYLDSDRLFFVYHGLVKPIRFSYPSKAVSDLEIHDRSLMSESLETSLFIPKITPSPLVIILSKNITFQKKIGSDAKEETKREFLESIPFENVSAKHYQAHPGGLLVVTNKDFHQEFQTIFSAHGFSIEAIIPEVVLSSGVNIFNPKQSDSYVMQNLTPSTVRSLSLVSLNNRYEPRIQRIARKQFSLNKNLFTLLIVFVFALLVLAGSYTYARIQSSRPVPVVFRPIVDTPTKIVADDPLSVQIRIYYFGKNQEQAKQLQSSLWVAGFKSTDLVATTSAITKTTLSVSSQLSANITQKISLELDKIDSGYSLIQADNSRDNSNIYLSSYLK